MDTSRMYLQRIHMAAFGRFFDTTIGPFAPGLNVVYGRNETGKSTAAAFVEGVLFGWEDARGRKNVYKPERALRSGSLFFADEAGEVYEISRTRNTDGASFAPAEAKCLLDGIDKDTFSTMFSLTSDELLGLEGAADMASKLLTAGSGTAASPAAVLAALDARIASYTSRAASAEHSFIHLRAEEEDCKRRLAQARAESDALKDEYREHEQLGADRARLAEEVTSSNARIETLASARAQVSRLEHEVEEQERTMAACRARADSLARPSDAASAVLFPDAPAEARAAATVERLQGESERIARRVDAARNAFSTARAAAQEERRGSAPRVSSHTLFVSLGVVCALAAVAGIALLAWAAASGFAAGIIAGAIVAAASSLAAAATAREARRPAADGADAADRAMERARMVLEDCENEELVFSLRAKDEMAAVGLAAAEGSLSQAKALIDASRTHRSEEESRMRERDHAMRRFAEARRACDEARAHIDEQFALCGMDPDQGLEALEQAEDGLRTRRARALERLRAADSRLGELKQLLRAGAHSTTLDVLKTQQAQIATRKDEAAAGLAELLLARRAMAASLDAWKGESVPAVYRRASELLSLMTEGAWREVRMEEDGALVAIDAVHTRREPRLLSTGTCQQLYLALRISLLERAAGVGAGLPVLADDILVNFDDERRRGAVRALDQLAQSRQVVVFTCHKEILEAVRSNAASPTVVAL